MSIDPNELHEQLGREVLHNMANAMPLVEGDGLIDEVHSGALEHDLLEINPGFLGHIRRQIVDVTEEVELRLDGGPEEGTFIITHNQLRGAVARGVIRGVTQTVVDIGQQLLFDEELRTLLDEPGESAA